MVCNNYFDTMHSYETVVVESDSVKFNSNNSTSSRSRVSLIEEEWLYNSLQCSRKILDSNAYSKIMTNTEFTT